MTVFIYVNTSKQIGDPDHLKVFDTAEAAQAWFDKNDPEGVAFEYEVLTEGWSATSGGSGGCSGPFPGWMMMFLARPDDFTPPRG